MNDPAPSRRHRWWIALLLVAAVLLVVFRQRDDHPEPPPLAEARPVSRPVTPPLTQPADESRNTRTRPDRDQSTPGSLAGEPSPARPRDGVTPDYWRKDPTPDSAPIVPSGFSLSPPSAVASIGNLELKPQVNHGTFERVSLQPSGKLKVDFVWPAEHKIAKVAVQGLHGGTIVGQAGRVIDVKNDGTFSFTFVASAEAGHDEIVLTAANVTFNMPVWVADANGKILPAATINP